MGVNVISKSFLIVGANHRSAGVTLRDRIFVDDDTVPLFLSALRDAQIIQGIVLSTCDRVEVMTFSDDVDQDYDAIKKVMSEHADLSSNEATSLTAIKDNEAIGYLFRIASSLESVVVGEPQILGQVKACHRLARNEDMISSELEGLLQAAYTAAKRVRTETAIGERPVSIAAVAVGVARDVHGRLENANALIIGRGDMGEVIGGELIRANIGSLSVADIGSRSSSALATQLRARHIAENDLSNALADADIVVTAMGGRSLALTADMVRAALKTRRFRPQFIVDAGLPGDVEPSVDRLNDAFLYDLQDLERLAIEGLENRVTEADAAAFIVREEVTRYGQDRQARKAAPALSALRSHVNALRNQALMDADGDAERATHMLMQRLLHTPSERLRTKAAAGENIEIAEDLIRDLFGITEDEDDST